MPSHCRGLTVIGWREPIALPDWGIASIKTKIDTGARTSAIHVDNINQISDRRVRFDVVLHPRKASKEHLVAVETDIVRVSRVRLTSGHIQERLVVATTMLLAGLRRQIELSLVCRHGMLCRLLLGRAAVRGLFLIDPNRRRLLAGPPINVSTAQVQS